MGKAGHNPRGRTTGRLAPLRMARATKVETKRRAETKSGRRRQLDRGLDDGRPNPRPDDRWRQGACRLSRGSGGGSVAARRLPSLKALADEPGKLAATEESGTPSSQHVRHLPRSSASCSRPAQRSTRGRETQQKGRADGPPVISKAVPAPCAIAGVRPAILGPLGIPARRDENRDLPARLLLVLGIRGIGRDRALPPTCPLVAVDLAHVVVVRLSAVLYGDR
ncbi:MAG: hypothetical protein JWM85_1801 [Acidimicrobiaceae bacterium]|nr:hypothetical protein [Acidimicrobiaceae bacterium]